MGAERDAKHAPLAPRQWFLSFYMCQYNLGGLVTAESWAPASETLIVQI